MKTTVLALLLMLSLPSSLWAQAVKDVLHKVEEALSANEQAKAVSYFRQAVRMDTANAEMFYWTRLDKSTSVVSKMAHELAAFYKKNKNFDKAYLFYKELTQQVPNHVDYLSACAEVQVERGKEKEAARLYERVLKLDDDHLAANIFLGNYYYLQAEMEKKQIEADYRKIASPTKMQYASYRDRLARLFSSEYLRAKSALQKVVGKFSSAEAKKTLNKIVVIEKEVNP